MDFRLLGPLEVYEGQRPISLGGPKQRALLAILLLNANDVLASDELMHDLWTRLPDTAGNTLHAHVSRLRKTLGRSRIVTRGSGYMLRLDDGERDIERFEDLAADGRDALLAGDPVEAGRLLRGALDLWRGPVLAGLDPERFAAAETKRLDEERLAVLEDRIEADLAAGLHAELVPELEQLTVEHALRERLRGQLMLALYRSGRQADALDAYRQTRRMLVDELGIEPGPALRRLETAILLQEPRLEVAENARVEPVTARGSSSRPIAGVPFVGRELELAHLQQAFREAREQRRCHLVSVIGAPGTGKSRVARELLGGLRRDAVGVIGRCMPQGEGAALWPLAEIVKQLAGDTSREAIHGLLENQPRRDVISHRLSEVCQRGIDRGEQEDALWAARKFLEDQARRRPHMVVLDDAHWADDALHGLVEDLTEWSQDVPLLIVCLARPELLESRPMWAGGKLNSSTLALQPLSPDAAGSLLEALAGKGRLTQSERELVLATAEGNPLFLEQMVALALERGIRGDVLIPPTIQATLALRLDRLPEEDRGVLGKAAVVGRRFWMEALAAVTNIQTRELLAVLRRLMRRDLIKPDDSSIPGYEGLTFTHGLIRDAAYEVVPMTERAKIHERAADWLESAGDSDAHELDELIGSHLERAFVTWRDSGRLTPRRKGLAVRAATALSSTQRRELGHAGIARRIGSLQRAAALLSEGKPLRIEILANLAADLEQAGDWRIAEEQYAQAVSELDSARDPALSLYVHALRDLGRVKRGEEASLEDAIARVSTAAGQLASMEANGYAEQLNTALGGMHLSIGKAVAAERLLKPVAEQYRRGSYSRASNVAWRILTAAWLWGPEPARRAIRKCEELVAGDPPLRVVASAYRSLAVLHSMRGDYATARMYAAQDGEILRDLDLVTAAAGMRTFHAMVEINAGDDMAAVEMLYQARESLHRMDDRWFAAGISALLAWVLARRGECGAAADLLADVDDHRSRDSVVGVWCNEARAMIAAASGELSMALEASGQAISLAADTDHLVEQGRAHIIHAETLVRAGHLDHATRSARKALALNTEKENKIGAQEARSLLKRLASA